MFVISVRSLYHPNENQINNNIVEPAYTITSTAKDSIVIEQDAKYTEVY
jgi:hypothetical protein